PVRVLFAFGDKHRAVGKLQQLRPAIDDAALVELPRPSAVAVRPTLPEVFRLVANDLIEQLTALIDVIVGGRDSLTSAAIAFSLRRKWCHAEFRPHMVFAHNDVVTAERVDDDAVTARVQLDRKRPIFW